MYNTTKHLVGKIGSILAMVLGGFILFSVLMSLISLFKLPSGANIADEFMLAFFIGLGGRAALGFVFLSFGTATMCKPVAYTFNGVTFWSGPSKGKNVALIIISGILFFLGFMATGLVDSFGGISAGGGYYVELSVETGLQWIQNLSCLGVMVLKIAYLCMKEAPVPTETQGQSANTTTQSTANKSASSNQAGAASASKYCPYCGAQFQDGNKFCPNCGAKRF